VKNQLLCGVAAGAITAALSGPVSAAPPIPSVYNWTGFYIGGHVGSARTKFDGTWFGDSGTTDFGQNRSATAGGVHGGVNWQHNMFVLGLEGDVTFLNAKSDVFSFSGVPGSGDQLASKLNLLSSLRGRLGIVLNNNLLLYFTGGFAHARGKTEGFDGGTFLSATFNKDGGVYGGGAEWAFAGNWIARVEALQYKFNDSAFLVGPSDSATSAIHDAFVARFGLSYKFGLP
jgi:outer membrane immunogenic protein